MVCIEELTMKKPNQIRELYIGIMSGTSLDGIDTALVEITDDHVRLIDHYDHPIPSDLKQRVLDIAVGQETNLREVGEIDHLLGHLYADAVLELLFKSSLQAEQITAIGNHGQTVFHQPVGNTPFTMQLGDANIIAARTGIDTIADFRRADMALGGQGAPLVPAFHQDLFGSLNKNTVVLNIGGIANVSVLRPNQPVIGYDTGPGNMLMDAWCERHTGDRFDKNGQLARKGFVDDALLSTLMAEPYLRQAPPKSTGRELFNLAWLDDKLQEFDLSIEDIQRTLCEYTALTIANEVDRYFNSQGSELLICGGGGRNPLLVERLAHLLPRWNVSSTTSKGVDSDNMEAMAFAWLAYRRTHDLPSNLPEVTGASKAVSLGVIYLADKLKD